MSAYSLIPDLAAEIEVPADGTLSRTLLNTDEVKVVLFAFSKGQELSEHTASMAATLAFIEGDAQVTLGGDSAQVSAGAWIHMPPQLKHSIKALTPLKMLLLLHKRSRE